MNLERPPLPCGWRRVVALAAVTGAASLSGFLGAATAATTAPDNARVFYVAPNGRDAWSGTLAEPNGAGTDGPFATLARARDAIRQLKSTAIGRAGSLAA